MAGLRVRALRLSEKRAPERLGATGGAAAAAGILVRSDVEDVCEGWTDGIGVVRGRDAVQLEPPQRGVSLTLEEWELVLEALSFAELNELRGVAKNTPIRNRRFREAAARFKAVREHIAASVMPWASS